MIHTNILSEIHSDYLNSHADRDTLPQLQHSQDFWRWFGNNAHVYQSLKEEQTFQCTKEFCHSGRCFGNAQTVTLRHEKVLYCEGFMLLGEKGYYLHGFNLIDAEVLDCTVIGNPEVFNEFGGYPTEYCGMIIPNDFIQTLYPRGEIGEYEGSPLLWDYYLASTQASRRAHKNQSS